MNIEIHSISGLETYPVRHPVLRIGRPIEDCYFNGDELRDTIHLGAYLDNNLIAVATFLLNRDPAIIELENHHKSFCYQLRGMAVLKHMQGKQIGKKLLHHAERLLIEKKVTALWFNARTIAVPFYKKQGYQIASAPFEIKSVGEHYKMYKSL